MLKAGRNNVAGGITMNDIHWVLTVPAIWSDAAKQFMREAAIKVSVILASGLGNALNYCQCISNALAVSQLKLTPMQILFSGIRTWLVSHVASAGLEPTPDTAVK